MNNDRLSNTKKNFNRASKTYDKEAYVHQQVANYLYCHLTKHGHSSKILDIGSGTSILSNFITKNFPEENIVNSDLSEEMLKVAKKKYPHSQFILSDMRNLPFSEEFDLVLSSMSLQWLEDPTEIVDVISKHLKNNGNFAVSVVLKGTFAQITRLRKKIVDDSISSGLDNSSQAERLPIFDDLMAAFNTSNLTLNRAEKHLFKQQYETAEDCFTAIKNLGIAGDSNRKLSREEFKTLLDSYKAEISALEMSPELDYQVGFFWGTKS